MGRGDWKSSNGQSQVSEAVPIFDECYWNVFININIFMATGFSIVVSRWKTNVESRGQWHNLKFVINFAWLLTFSWFQYFYVLLKRECILCHLSKTGTWFYVNLLVKKELLIFMQKFKSEMYFFFNKIGFNGLQTYFFKWCIILLWSSELSDQKINRNKSWLSSQLK